MYTFFEIQSFQNITTIKKLFIALSLLIFSSVSLAKTTVENTSSRATEEWLETVKQNIQASYYNFSIEDAQNSTELHYSAPNLTQGYHTTFSSKGLHVKPSNSEQFSWTWGLSLESITEDNKKIHLSNNKFEVDANQLEYQYGNVTEWYINNKKGLEQGFTIHQAAFKNSLQTKINLKINGTTTSKLSELKNAIDFFDRQGKKVLTYNKLIAIDADGKTLHSNIALNDSTLSLVVDTKNARYPIVIDPLLSNPDWQVESNFERIEFGVSVSSAGDVDNDGYADVIVGGLGQLNNSPYLGRVFLYLGTPTGLSTKPSWSVVGSKTGAYFGKSVAGLGDVNGDTFDDIIIGEPLSSNDAGSAYIYFGNASGVLAATPDWEVTIPKTVIGTTTYREQFGSSVAGAGDVNGDQIADIIIGAPAFNPDATGYAGKVYVYHGVKTPGVISTTATWSYSSTNYFENLGNTVASAGNVNGDSYDDIIVSSNNAVRVYYGSANGISTANVWIAPNRGVANGAGDVNGDAIDDIIIGFRAAKNNNNLISGAAYVFLGTKNIGFQANATADWILYPNEPQSNSYFGDVVAGVGDLNGDSLDDIAIGESGFDNGVYTDAGKVHVYLGQINGQPSAPNWTKSYKKSYRLFGSSIASAGDINKSGLSDLIIGSRYYSNTEFREGAAYIFYGSKQNANLIVTGTVTPDPADVNSTVTYNLNINNSGPDIAEDVILNIVLPADITNPDFSAAIATGWSCSELRLTVTCTIASLAVGSNTSAVISATTPLVFSNLSTDISVSSNIPDLTLANNSIQLNSKVAVLATPAIVISPSSGHITSEAGTTSTFTINSNTRPLNDVTVTFNNVDTTEGSLSLNSVLITAANWNQPQEIIITGVDDLIVDGNISYAITLAVTSADANYDNIQTVNINVINEDDGVDSNAPPEIVNLNSPSNLDQLKTGIINFNWDLTTDADGDSVSYKIVVCDNATYLANNLVMDNCPTTVVASLRNRSVQYAQLGKIDFTPLILMILFIFAVVAFQQFKTPRAVVLVLAMLFLNSCGGGGSSSALPDAPKTQTSFSVNLAPGVYYWKVQADDNLGFRNSISDSEVRKLTIVN